jgi:hypothetical protein
MHDENGEGSWRISTVDRVSGVVRDLTSPTGISARLFLESPDRTGILDRP